MRSLTVLTREGFVEFLLRILDTLRRQSFLSSKAHRDYIRHKTEADVAFDKLHQTDTGGIQHLHQLTIDSTNARYGISHIASDSKTFETAVSSIDLDLNGYHFVDLGSGRGRALILALNFPFERIVGVEFAEETYQTAVSNIKRVLSNDPSAKRIELIHGDAAEYNFPSAALAVYMYHPFDVPIMRKVARRLRASCKCSEQQVRVIYVNPRHFQIWVDEGWQVITRGDEHIVLAPGW